MESSSGTQKPHFRDPHTKTQKRPLCLSQVGLTMLTNAQTENTIGQTIAILSRIRAPSFTKIPLKLGFLDLPFICCLWWHISTDPNGDSPPPPPTHQTKLVKQMITELPKGVLRAKSKVHSTAHCQQAPAPVHLLCCRIPRA